MIWGFVFWQERGFCVSSQDVETGSGIHPLVLGGLLPGLKQPERDVEPHLHLVPRLRRAGAVPVLALQGIHKYSFTFLDS
jgi:hypothetical protein